MQYTILSLGLGALGALLLLSPDTLISPDTTNQTLQTVYDNHTLIGVALLAAAAYLYMNYVKSDNDYGNNSSLPTYEESEIEYSTKTPSYMKSEGSYRSKRSS